MRQCGPTLLRFSENQQSAKSEEQVSGKGEQEIIFSVALRFWSFVVLLALFVLLV
jgi:Ni,Fe-hydrogenase I cytochrome b subunit